MSPLTDQDRRLHAALMNRQIPIGRVARAAVRPELRCASCARTFAAHATSTPSFVTHQSPALAAVDRRRTEPFLAHARNAYVHGSTRKVDDLVKANAAPAVSTSPHTCDT